VVHRGVVRRSLQFNGKEKIRIWKKTSGDWKDMNSMLVVHGCKLRSLVTG